MRSKASDAKLINLFLDMLAAEQGAGANTLDAYRRDLTDLSDYLVRNGETFAGVGTDGLAQLQERHAAALETLFKESVLCGIRESVLRGILTSFGRSSWRPCIYCPWATLIHL